jgi:hypothetical protein
VGGGGATTVVDGEVGRVLWLGLHDHRGIWITLWYRNEAGNHSAHRLTRREALVAARFQWSGRGLASSESCNGVQWLLCTCAQGRGGGEMASHSERWRAEQGTSDCNAPVRKMRRLGSRELRPTMGLLLGLFTREK